MSENLIRFSLRIPEGLHSELKNLADQDMRSLNMYIIKVLENHVIENKVRGTQTTQLKQSSQGKN